MEQTDNMASERRQVCIMYICTVSGLVTVLGLTIGKCFMSKSSNDPLYCESDYQRLGLM